MYLSPEILGGRAVQKCGKYTREHSGILSLVLPPHCVVSADQALVGEFPAVVRTKTFKQTSRVCLSAPLLHQFSLIIAPEYS